MIAAAALALMAAGGAMQDSEIVLAVADPSALPAGGHLLGRGKGLAWGASSFSAAIPLANASAAKARLAWLSLGSFQSDIGGLGKTAVAAVVAHRVRIQTDVLTDMAEELASRAARLAAVSGDTGSPFFRVFREGFSIGRIAGTAMEESVRALEDRAALDALEGEHEGSSAKDTAVSARTRLALSRAASALGRPGLEKAPVASRSVRAFFLRGNKSLLQAGLDRREIPSVKMRGGRLALLEPSQAESIRETDKPVTVFLTAARYAHCLRLETPAQLEAHVSAIVARGGPDSAAYLEAIEETRMQLLLRLSVLLSAAKPLPQAERDGLGAALKEELGRLASSSQTSSEALSERMEVLSVYASAAGEMEIGAWALRGDQSIRSMGRP